jgi:hypothetical protein
MLDIAKAGGSAQRTKRKGRGVREAPGESTKKQSALKLRHAVFQLLEDSVQDVEVQSLPQE